MENKMTEKQIAELEKIAHAELTAMEFLADYLRGELDILGAGK